MTGQSETKHTPGDLTIAASDTLFTMVSEDGVQVAKTSWHGSIRKPYPLRDEARANAARIALTWNCHDDLVALLSRASEADSPNEDVRTAWWEARAAVLIKATA